MPQEILNILLSALSIIVTGLVGWGVTALTTWLNKKIKDQKTASWLNRITEITTDAVMSVFQTFVETLKKEGKFDEAAQKEAKIKALEIIEHQLTPELENFIKTNYGDMKEWLNNKIEAIIYSLKK